MLMQMGMLMLRLAEGELCWLERALLESPVHGVVCRGCIWAKFAMSVPCIPLPLWTLSA